MSINPKLEQIRELLETPFWPESLAPRTQYLRYCDDTRKGGISVVFGDDGDGWIDVYQHIDPDDFNGSVRFRMPMTGGGQSPRVRNALLILAEAIRLDNLDQPQDRCQ